MSTIENPTDAVNRREFLKGTSFAAMMTLMGAVPIHAEAPKPEADANKYLILPEPLKFGVVGCGIWGREILSTLSRRPNAPVVAVCEHYEAYLRRARSLAPDAEAYTDYQQLLANKDVQAVVVATPSHQHKQIVLDALKAGKHVYCEAPLATTIEDARAIAQAAKASPRVNFQVGLQSRSDPQMTHLLNFIRTGVLGKPVKVRSQSHKKQMWRRTSPNPEREKEINWRLDPDVSLGLIGEIGIHQLDLARWFLMERPAAVTGFGGVMFWKDDGREVPDTVQAVFEFPSGVIFNQDCTIANSFDSDYDVFYGSDSAVMVRDRHAWMFKEADAQLLGWEVYARKEMFYKESGIVLGADATKLTKPAENAAPQPVHPNLVETALSHALKHFHMNCLSVANGVEDFVTSFGDKDAKALQDYLDGLLKNRETAATWQEGYESAVIAIKTKEAIQKQQRIAFSKEWFEIA